MINSLITQLFSKNLCFLLLATCLLALGCQGTPLTAEGVRKAELKLASGERIQTEVVVTEKDKTRGLSGRPSSSFNEEQAMLFLYLSPDYKSFWMPDTYFDLDIFFLTGDLVVSAIERNVPHHPGRDEYSQPIYRTQAYKCQHVLEMRADSPLSKKIKKGDKLIWTSTPSLKQILSNTHLFQ